MGIPADANHQKGHKATSMNQINYFKLFSLLAFAVFAGFSCWATAESLTLFNAKIPVILCWVVAIGFFVLASFGTKLILDSLNQNIFCEKRGLKLTLGIIMVFVFWLLFSMPTNTHTFLYRDNIHKMTSKDLTVSNEYLKQLADNQIAEQTYQAEVNQFKNEITILKDDFLTEITNPANPGYGRNSVEKRSRLIRRLGIPQAEGLLTPSNLANASKEQLDEVRRLLSIQIDTLINIAEKQIRQQYPENNAIDQAKSYLNENACIQEKIEEDEINLNDRDEVSKVVKVLERDYELIANNKKAINFNERDADTFKGKNPEPSVKRLMSVYDVWLDLFRGDLHAAGFAFWLVISILVDVAAFIFFYLATKR